MFIRWKRRRLQRRNDVTLEAVLVQSVRIHGCPQQRLVRYLGSIHAQECQTTPSASAFWQRVATHLTVLDLDPATRQTLEHQLARVVPPPASRVPGETCRDDEVADATGGPMSTTPPCAPALLPVVPSVRWRRRRLRRSLDEAWDAILVRSIWHQGAARQQVVGYLASIRARYHTAPAHRAWFWTRVEARLEALALDAATRQAIEARLAQVIPRPTPGELADVAAQRAALAHWAQQTLP
jgi:hypothetical protein